MLSDEAIEEYQKIYKKQFGKDISKEEARLQGENLIRLFKVVYKPIPLEKKMNNALSEAEYVRFLIEKSFKELLKNDLSLLLFDVNERTITHKLAVYLEKYFPDYHVDCEYNRDGIGEGSKKIMNIRNNIPAITQEEVTPEDENAVTVYPDIIIHRRGIPEGFVVIEAKKKGNEIDPDQQKLKAYKRELGYKYAYQIIFPTTKDRLDSENWNYKELIKEVDSESHQDSI